MNSPSSPVGVGSRIRHLVRDTADANIWDWLALGDVSKVGTTLSAPVIGYLTVTGQLSNDLMAIAAVVSLLHFSMFVLNDVYDYEIDAAADRTEKPLVVGRIETTTAEWIGLAGLVVGSLFAPLLFSPSTCLVLYFGIGIGLLYNRISSSTVYGPFLLGCWAGVAVLFGAMVAGIPTTATLLLAALIGIMLLHMTYVADVRDISDDVHTLPQALGIQDQGDYIEFSTASLALEVVLNVVKVGLVAAIISNGYYFGLIAVLALIPHLYYNTHYVFDAASSPEKFLDASARFYRTGMAVLVFGLAAYVDPVIVVLMIAATFSWGYGVKSALSRPKKVHMF